MSCPKEKNFDRELSKRRKGSIQGRANIYNIYQSLSLSLSLYNIYIYIYIYIYILQANNRSRFHSAWHKDKSSG